MNKSDLTEALATDLNLSTGSSRSIVNTILATMTETLVQGNTIEIRGFGSFRIRKYEAYTGRHPKTGEETHVKSKKLPFFKVGKELREALKNHKN